jgi:hypothetical protein
MDAVVIAVESPAEALAPMLVSKEASLASGTADGKVCKTRKRQRRWCDFVKINQDSFATNLPPSEAAQARSPR